MILRFVYTSIFFAAAAIAAENVSKDVSSSQSENFPVKVCIGPLGQGNEKGSRTHPNDSGFQVLRINKYESKPGEIVYLQRKKYAFASKAGSFFYDFSKSKKHEFFVDAANYGGLSIQPLASNILCDKSKWPRTW